MNKSKIFWGVFFKKDKFGRSPFRALLFSALLIFISFAVPMLEVLKPIGFIFLLYSLVSPIFLYIKMLKRE